MKRSVILSVAWTSRPAYGNDSMLAETRDALLYAQLKEGLKYELMRAPAVSGALQKRRQYQPPVTRKAFNQTQGSSGAGQPKQTKSHYRSVTTSQPKQGRSQSISSEVKSRKCWNCDQLG